VSQPALSLVCVGATGDVISLLPLFKKWADEGRRSRLIVSPTYASLLDGVSYVDVQVLDEPWVKRSANLSVIERAVRKATADLPLNKVVWLTPRPGTMPHGPRTTSFITWMWSECGELRAWDTLPLVFDRRSPAREAALVQQFHDGRPLILLATTGFSSPFPHRNKLFSLVSSQFPECNVLDMAAVKAERFYDLLGLMEVASCLITIDTAHWHLAQACDVPTIALAQDSELWKGSPMSRRHLLHCRYRDYEARAPEIVGAVAHALDGGRPLTPTHITGLPVGAYNPSVLPWEGGWLMAYRFHPEPGNWRTQLGMAQLDQNFRVTKVQRMVTPGSTGGMSCEDPRLFVLNSEPWASITIAKPDGKSPKCVVAYGPLREESGGWRITELYQPKFGRNDWSALEKNWIPVVDFGWLRFIYDTTKVITVEGDRVIKVQETVPASWPWGDIHGGTPPLPHSSGLLLRFFHSRDINKHRSVAHRYHIGAMLLEPGTLRPVKVSTHPIISGSELLTPSIFHYKPSVVFPTSAIALGPDMWKLVLGTNDCHCATLDLHYDDLNL